MIEEAEFELVEGTGNVFRDLGDPDAVLKQAKAVLAADIIAALDDSGLTVRKAGELTGFAAADFSRVRNANLGRFTIDRLMRIHAALTRTSGSVVRTFVPPFLMATANDIENWAITHGARDQLAVFLRMLVHSTCNGLEFVDFPGNDDAQRPGWDGSVETTVGNPWVPVGTSRWEFGTNDDVVRKANKDYAKRTAETDATERRRTVFVFVTPRRWHGKASWLGDRQAEGNWLDVRAWDASDLEQWLEKSIPAQAWFVGRLGNPFRGVMSLQQCWVEWCADCKPSFTEDVFAEAISAFGEKVLSHLRNETQDALRIIADSRQEGLAFLAAVLSRSDETAELKDRVVVFTKPGAMSDLAVGAPGFIPVIVDSEVEAELAQSGIGITALVVDHRTAVQYGSGISLEPLSHHGFREALGSLGLVGDEIDRLDRESGRSLTVLRRRLTRNEAIRTPNWCSEAELAESLAPMALAGAWVVSNEADRYLMGELAGCDYDDLETSFTRLLNLEDSPVWSVGDYRGVVSKVDSLYGIARWMGVDIVDRFLEVAEIVLSGRDPALDLPEEEQFMVSLNGKAREISSPLRKATGESLVLLAIHGGRLFGNRMVPDPERKVADLVCELLDPMTTDKLLSQSSNLTLYAEAAPEAFLSMFEQDMDRTEPVVGALMKPAGDILYGGSDRADLMWALELLAWRAEWLDRVVDLLARLAALEPDDNLHNKPSESLLSIFRSWMPQTTAVVQHRIEILDRLVKEHPDIAWRIAVAQFNKTQSVGCYAHKPIWRDYAVGCGEPVTIGEQWEFVPHCIETCIHWPSHTRKTLADLLGNIQGLVPSQLAHLDDAVAEWAQSASDEDRAWLRERIRVSLQRNKRRKSKENSRQEKVDDHVLTARKAFEILEPQDTVWKHAWLFEKPWVEEAWEEMEEAVDLQTRDKRIKALRSQAVGDVLSELGHAGVLRLAFSGDAPNVVGESLAQQAKDQGELLSFVWAVLGDGDVLASRRHQFLISGLFDGMGSSAAVSLVETLRQACTDDVGVMLLCLVGFERPVWSKLEAVGETVSSQYWDKVEPTWRTHGDEDINYAVSRLLAAGRPLVALNFAYLDWGRVESRHIHAMLSDLPGSVERKHGIPRLDPHHIQQALKVLDERCALTQTEMARLELLYLDLFCLDEDGVPNLEREVENKPELFCEAVTLAYPHPREGDDHAVEPTESELKAAQRANRLLDKLACVPGHDDDGVLNERRLTDWIRRAQELCEENGRRRVADHHIGQLLSKAPAGKDGIWPCEPVREALEIVLNDDIKTGFQIGRQKSRGTQLRGEGGTQERELTEQYEEWAKACGYSYPKVAAALRGLASAYEDEGRWWDREAAIQQRLGY